MNRLTDVELMQQYQQELADKQKELSGLSRSKINVQETTNPRIAVLKREIFLLERQIGSLERKLER